MSRKLLRWILRKLLFVLCSVYSARMIFALPSDFQLISGEAELSRSSKDSIDICVSDSSILHWNEFSIQENERVSFIQPSSTSCVLNRVVGENPSNILGFLESNGKVLLLNSRGIFFGEKARIDVGSLVASTLDIQDTFFDNREWHFAGQSEMGIKNLGQIHAAEGDLIFLSNQIENRGGLYAANGTVALGATQDLSLSPFDSKQIFIRASARNGAFIDHSGVIHAVKVEFIHGDGLYPDHPAFDHSGSTHALGTFEREGEISLFIPRGDVLIQGIMSAQNGDGSGGQIHLFGERIGLFKNALLDVSGATSGNGGKVLLLSDLQTSFYGQILAQGGELKGDGGFVEISSHRLLVPEGKVDTSAQNGKTGTLLLDPTDVTISNGANAGISTFPSPNNYIFSGPTATISTVSVPTLQSFLATNSVVINTNNGFGGAGDITVSNTITWAAPNNSLTLIANQDILIDAPISASGTGANIILNAGRNIQVRANVQNTAVAPGGTITLIANTGDINLTAPLAGGTYVGTNFGNTLVRATLGNVSISGGTVANSGAIIGSTNSTPAIVSGDISVEAGQSITLTGGTGTFSFANISRSPHFSPTATNTVTGNIVVTAGRNISAFAGSSSFSYALIGNTATTAVTGDIQVNAGGNLTLRSGSQFLLDRAVIGADAFFLPVYLSNLTVNVLGDLLIGGTVGGNPGLFAFIGYNVLGAGSATSTRVQVAGNIYLDGRNTNALFFPAYNSAAVVNSYNPECYIHCLGNMLFLGGSNANGGEGAPWSIRVNPSQLAFTYHLWSGNSILCLNGATNNASLQSVPQGQFLNHSYRACGDITQASNGTIPTFAGTGSFTGSGYPSFSGIFIEANTCFATGELWSAQTAFVNGVNIFNSTLLGSPSPPRACTNSGAFGIDTTRYNLNVLPLPYNGAQVPLPVFSAAVASASFRTLTGNVVLHSSSQFAGELFRPAFATGTLANLIQGNGVNNIALATTSGNIEISGSNGPTLGGCGCIDSFNNITINLTQNPWTSGSIYVSANNDLTISTPIVTSTASPITMISDFNHTGAGNLSIGQDITSAGGPITLNAGFGINGFSSITQTGGTVSSNGGNISAQAAGDILLSGAATSFTSGSGSILIESTIGNIQIDETVASSSGPIDVISHTGNVQLTTLTGNGGEINTGSGPMSLNAGANILLNGAPTTLLSVSGAINSVAGDNTDVITNVSTAGPVQMISGNNMILSGTANVTSTGSGVTLVVDADFPSPPLIGPGYFNLESTAQVNSAGPLRIYTAQQSLNSILGMLNGLSFSAGTLFVDTASEIWCTYFPTPISGFAFTIAYKPCLQQVAEQAMIIVTQLNLMLEQPNFPYYGMNEYLGYPSRFIMFYRLSESPNLLHDGYASWPPEKYFLNFKNISLIERAPKVY